MVKHKTSTRTKIFPIFVFLSVITLLTIVFVSKNRIKEEYNSCDCDTTQEVITDESLGTFEGVKVDVPKLTSDKPNAPVLGENADEKWIEVDLSEQKLRAWQGDGLFLETLVSTGLPWYATPTGEFRIWAKFRATKMEGGSGKYYYYLPNVPYVMFFENESIPGRRGFSLHGTYWHNDFGRVRSHGCVNLPTPIAQQLYYWTTPNLADGKSYVRAEGENFGTRIVIHE